MPSLHMPMLSAETQYALCVQVLLLLSGGSRGGSLPIMAVAFFAMLRSWIGVPALTACQCLACIHVVLLLRGCRLTRIFTTHCRRCQVSRNPWQYQHDPCLTGGRVRRRQCY